MDDEGELFEVECFLSTRKKDGKRYYKIRWKGFPPDEDTWEPEENVLECREALEAFWGKKRKASNKQKQKRRYHVNDDQRQEALSSTSSTVGPNNVENLGFTRQATKELYMFKARDHLRQSDLSSSQEGSDVMPSENSSISQSSESDLYDAIDVQSSQESGKMDIETIDIMSQESLDLDEHQEHSESSKMVVISLLSDSESEDSKELFESPNGRSTGCVDAVSTTEPSITSPTFDRQTFTTPFSTDTDELENLEEDSGSLQVDASPTEMEDKALSSSQDTVEPKADGNTPGKKPRLDLSLKKTNRKHNERRRDELENLEEDSQSFLIDALLIEMEDSTDKALSSSQDIVEPKVDGNTPGKKPRIDLSLKKTNRKHESGIGDENENLNSGSSQRDALLIEMEDSTDKALSSSQDKVEPKVDGNTPGKKPRLDLSLKKTKRKHRYEYLNSELETVNKDKGKEDHNNPKLKDPCFKIHLTHLREKMKELENSKDACDDGNASLVDMSSTVVSCNDDIGRVPSPIRELKEIMCQLAKGKGMESPQPSSSTISCRNEFDMGACSEQNITCKDLVGKQSCQDETQLTDLKSEISSGKFEETSTFQTSEVTALDREEIVSQPDMVHEADLIRIHADGQSAKITQTDPSETIVQLDPDGVDVQTDSSEIGVQSDVNSRVGGDVHTDPSETSVQLDPDSRASGDVQTDPSETIVQSDMDSRASGDVQTDPSETSVQLDPDSRASGDVQTDPSETSVQLDPDSRASGDVQIEPSETSVQLVTDSRLSGDVQTYPSEIGVQSDIDCRVGGDVQTDPTEIDVQSDMDSRVSGDVQTDPSEIGVHSDMDIRVSGDVQTDPSEIGVQSDMDIRVSGGIQTDPVETSVHLDTDSRLSGDVQTDTTHHSVQSDIDSRVSGDVQTDPSEIGVQSDMNSRASGGVQTDPVETSVHLDTDSHLSGDVQTIAAQTSGQSHNDSRLSGHIQTYTDDRATDPGNIGTDIPVEMYIDTESCVTYTGHASSYPKDIQAGTDSRVVDTAKTDDVSLVEVQIDNDQLAVQTRVVLEDASNPVPVVTVQVDEETEEKQTYAVSRVIHAAPSSGQSEVKQKGTNSYVTVVTVQSDEETEEMQTDATSHVTHAAPSSGQSEVKQKGTNSSVTVVTVQSDEETEEMQTDAVSHVIHAAPSSGQSEVKHKDSTCSVTTVAVQAYETEEMQADAASRVIHPVHSSGQSAMKHKDSTCSVTTVAVQTDDEAERIQTDAASRVIHAAPSSGQSEVKHKDSTCSVTTVAVQADETEQMQADAANRAAPCSGQSEVKQKGADNHDISVQSDNDSGKLQTEPSSCVETRSNSDITVSNAGQARSASEQAHEINTSLLLPDQTVRDDQVNKGAFSPGQKSRVLENLRVLKAKSKLIQSLSRSNSVQSQSVSSDEDKAADRDLNEEKIDDEVIEIKNNKQNDAKTSNLLEATKSKNKENRETKIQKTKSTKKKLKPRIGSEDDKKVVDNENENSMSKRNAMNTKDKDLTTGSSIDHQLDTPDTVDTLDTTNVGLTKPSSDIPTKKPKPHNADAPNNNKTATKPNQTKQVKKKRPKPPSDAVIQKKKKPDKQVDSSKSIDAVGCHDNEKNPSKPRPPVRTITKMKKKVRPRNNLNTQTSEVTILSRQNSKDQNSNTLSKVNNSVSSSLASGDLIGFILHEVERGNNCNKIQPVQEKKDGVDSCRNEETMSIDEDDFDLELEEFPIESLLDEEISPLRDIPSPPATPIEMSYAAVKQAIKEGDEMAVRSALAGGLELDVLDGASGMTLLMLASAAGQDGVVELLLRRQADVNAVQKNGMTALLHACEQGCPETAHVLLMCGADINSQQNAGETALIKASRKGHADVIEVLLKHGADTKIETKSGQTAYRLALPSPYEEIQTLLEEHEKRLGRAVEKAISTCLGDTVTLCKPAVFSHRCVVPGEGLHFTFPFQYTSHQSSTSKDVVLFCIKASFTDDVMSLLFGEDNGVRGVLLNNKSQIPLLHGVRSIFSIEPRTGQNTMTVQTHKCTVSSKLLVCVYAIQAS